jgi:hypothetical protein
VAARILQAFTTTLTGENLTISGTFASPCTPKSTIWVVPWIAESTNNAHATSCSDTINTYTNKNYLLQAPGGISIETWIAQNQATATHATVTVTWPSPGPNFNSFVVYEVGGVSIVSFDGSTLVNQNAPGTGANAVTNGPPGNTKGGIMVAVALSKNGDTGMVPGTGFSASIGWGNFGGGNVGASEFRLVGPGAGDATFTAGASFGSGVYSQALVVLDSALSGSVIFDSMNF